MERFVACALAGLSGALAGSSSAQTPWISVQGQTISDAFGSSLAAGGDLDGDGHGDFWVGALSDQLAGEMLGSARAYSGATGKQLGELWGPQATSHFGEHIVGGFDWDLDGSFDVAIGARGVSIPGFSAGRVYVYSGVGPQKLATFAANSGGDFFGDAFDVIGDVDGDGGLEIAIGAPQDDALPLTNCGTVTVHSSASGAQLYALGGTVALGGLGRAVIGTGDLDLDGFPDLVAASPSGIGFVRAYSGASGAVLYTIHGPAGGEWAYLTLAPAGDLDEDGRADFYIGAPWVDAQGIDSGELRAHSGADGSLIYKLSGPPGAEFGQSIARVGDLDGDGKDEVVIGSPKTPSRAGELYFGAVRLISGADGAQLALFEGQGGFFGEAVAGIGDVQGDGVPDFACGAPDYKGLEVGGLVRVHSGSSQPLWSAHSQLSLSTGVPQTLALDAGAQRAGHIYLVLGSLSGTAPGLPTAAGILPLTADAYLQATLALPNTAVLQGSLGVFDALGSARARFAPPNLSALHGKLVHHAYVALEPGGALSFISNAVPTTLVP
jgi:hypothetical protein